MAIRVFELARELSVTSKQVLEKCRAEGIELPNHMTALSAGLEATIREWFSQTAAHTAVETATHVDLEDARKKAAAQRRRRRKAEVAGEEPPAAAQAGALAAATAVEPAPTPPVAVAELPAVVEPPAPPAVGVPVPPPAPAVPEPRPAAPAPIEPPAHVAPAAQVAPVEPVAAPSVSEPKAVRNEPVRPKIVRPAGPQVVPKPATLRGPRVVRFDGVELQVPVRRPPLPPALAGGKSAPAAGGAARKDAVSEEEGEKAKKGVKRRSPRRKSGRSADTTEGLREWRDRDLMERSARLAAASGGTLRRHRAAPQGRGAQPGQPAVRGAQVEVEEPITVKRLSAATGLKITDLIRRLVGHGLMATINSVLEKAVAETVCLDCGIELAVKTVKSAEDLLDEEFAHRPGAQGQLVARAPIVTFLGHVDHGKTSLLDRIRGARVAAGEEGGITQGVGAYRCDKGDKHVVFLDTPGHEAFTAMRARGANMTDVVVLVVAADDGVMPQTVEAISHAKAAKVPIVVALNKIDLPNANVQRALGQLAEQGLQPREWGGNVEVIRTSAATGEGIDELVEMLSLEAELLELKADPTSRASGWVVESCLDHNRGVLAHMLVRDGTLRVGDVVLCGKAFGRVRSLSDDMGRAVASAGPATPVEVTGLDEGPDAGDRFQAVESLARAKAVAGERKEKTRARTASAATATTLENMFEQIEAGESSEVRLIVKVDVQGSLEALLKSLQALKNDEVKVSVLHSGVGGITEGDVLLAEASGAVIMGFRVVADSRARMLAEPKGVEMRTYRVIYQLIEDVQKVVTGLLAPEMVEKVSGRAEVREVFKVSRVGNVAGCYVLDGVIARNAKMRIIRNNVIVEDERQLASLRRFKEDVREARAGLECGMKIDGYDDIKTGDVIEAYQSVAVTR